MEIQLACIWFFNFTDTLWSTASVKLPRLFMLNRKREVALTFEDYLIIYGLNPVSDYPKRRDRIGMCRMDRDQHDDMTIIAVSKIAYKALVETFDMVKVRLLKQTNRMN